MINLFWSGVLILLMLSGCGGDVSPTRHNDFTPLTSIQIVGAAPSIAFGTSTKLSVTGNFSGLFTRDITSDVVWASDTPAVAEFITPTNPNRVTSHVPGTAILTATMGSVSTSFSLTVSPATISTMTITPSAPSIANGLNTQFSVSGTFSDATTQDLTFDATWVSSDPAVATVSDDPSSKGFAQSLAVGTSTISAAFNGVSGTTLLTVAEAVLQSITVSPANPSILSLSTANFTATGNYSDGSTPDITSQVAWTSSRSDFATIAPSGAATTLSQGTTSISASLNGVIGATNLKVTGGSLTGITLPAVNTTLVQGTVGRMTATGSFNNGTSRDITGVVVWSTANTNLATVTTPVGNLAWLNALAVTPVLTPTIVTAKSGTITATTNLTVSSPPLQSITISPNSTDMTAGTSSRFFVTANFNDGTTQDVTASSDWTSNAVTTATVGNSGLAKGRVNGVAAGAATISATYGGVTVTAPVTVNMRTIQSLTITGTSTVVSGNQVMFTATARYLDGTIKDVTEDTTWSVDKPYVAIFADMLNQPGQVVGVDTGLANLTAGFGGKTQSVTVSVP